MEKSYRGSFWKDHLWATLIIGGLGALLVAIPLIVFYLWINDVTSEGTPLGDIIFNAAIFIVLFLIGSAACFYLVWRGINERVRIVDGTMIYASTFFTRKIHALDIDKFMLFEKERPIVIYDVGEEKKRLKLPVWKSNDYVDDLIAELKRMNPNIGVSDLRPGAGEEVFYEPAEEEKS